METAGIVIALNQEDVNGYDEQMEEQCVEKAHVQNAYLNSVMEQIFKSPLPSYVPTTSSQTEFDEVALFTCKECDDKFVLKSSLQFHMARRSSLISYECTECAATITVYNRCSLLAHFRQHNESGDYICDPTKIHMAPLPFEKMLLGPLSNISEMESNCDPTFSKYSPNINGNTFDDSEEETCTECSERLREPLNKHFKGPDLPLDCSLKCKDCGLILPTKCSLKAHERYHKQEQPYICPECAKLFTDWVSYTVHLSLVCFHLEKRVHYKCPCCESVFMVYVALQAHMCAKHVRIVYKCHACPVACFTKQALQVHKLKTHGQHTLPSTRSYRQCHLCPDILLQESLLLPHIIKHIDKPALRLYGYQCSSCNTSIHKRQDFESHKKQCPEIKQKVTDNLEHVKPSIRVPINKTTHTQSVTFSPQQSIRKSLTKPLKCVSKTVMPLHRKMTLLPATKGGMKAKALHSQKTYTVESSTIKQMENNIIKCHSNSSVSKKTQNIFDDSGNSKSHGSVMKEITTMNKKKRSWILCQCIDCRKELVFSVPHSETSSLKLSLRCAACAKGQSNNNSNIDKSNPSDLNYKQLYPVKQTPTQENNKIVKDLPLSIIEKLQQEKFKTIAFNGPKTKKLKASSTFPTSKKEKFKCHICQSFIVTEWEAIQNHFTKEHKECNLLLLSPEVRKLETTIKPGTSVKTKEILHKRAKGKEPEEKPERSVSDARKHNINLSSDLHKSKSKRKMLRKEKQVASSPLISGQVVSPVKQNNFDVDVCSLNESRTNSYPRCPFRLWPPQPSGLLAASYAIVLVDEVCVHEARQAVPAWSLTHLCMFVPMANMMGMLIMASYILPHFASAVNFTGEYLRYVRGLYAHNSSQEDKMKLVLQLTNVTSLAEIYNVMVHYNHDYCNVVLLQDLEKHSRTRLERGALREMKTYCDILTGEHQLQSRKLSDDAEMVNKTVISRRNSDMRAILQKEKESKTQCRPQKTVVGFPLPPPGTFYFPRCTIVARCSGCCRNPLHKCTAETITYAKRKVIMIQIHPSAEKTKLLPRDLRVEKHTRCQCSCTGDISSCSPLQQYNESNCSCECSNNESRKYCFPPKTWNFSECRCQCPPSLGCSSGYIRDQQSCKCVPFISRNDVATPGLKPSKVLSG